MINYLYALELTVKNLDEEIIFKDILFVGNQHVEGVMESIVQTITNKYIGTGIENLFDIPLFEEQENLRDRIEEIYSFDDEDEFVHYQIEGAKVITIPKVN